MTVSEDRGTPAWIWRDEDGEATFSRPNRDTGCWEVSCPIGWRLKTDFHWGVALVDVYGLRMSAGNVLYYAERSAKGFRVRTREATG